MNPLPVEAAHRHGTDKANSSLIVCAGLVDSVNEVFCRAPGRYESPVWDSGGAALARTINLANLRARHRPHDWRVGKTERCRDRGRHIPIESFLHLISAPGTADCRATFHPPWLPSLAAVAYLSRALADGKLPSGPQKIGGDVVRPQRIDRCTSVCGARTFKRPIREFIDSDANTTTARTLAA